MEDTIKIQSINKSEWETTLQGFEPHAIEQILAVSSTNGVVIGIICESLEGKYYINGHPEFDYPSLETATGALLKGKRE
ncbi:MAG TPA: hypothetical protein DD379_08120 [Cyanobacteria bacterium UBA11162]|nr:hypothetical protein [Cyanobacteria bacterium UBA12227]HBL11360.1 hypothetical protein [Cyanobacteria bacterium UBA11162]